MRCLDDIDVSGSKILVVDDSEDIRTLLQKILQSQGFILRCAPDGEEALRMVEEDLPDLVLLGVRMPGMSGYNLCERLKAEEATRAIPVLFITGGGEASRVAEGFEAGGADYILKPFAPREVLLRVRNQLRMVALSRVMARQKEELEAGRRELAKAGEDLRSEAARRTTVTSERDRLAEQLSAFSRREAEHWGIPGLVGQSGVMKTILRSIEVMQGAGNTPALIMGESGTGKELVARAIHFGSRRSSAPFIALNCSTIPLDMAESLLFGHTRGAFTGADRDQAGHFDLANSGTIFLDEIGEMPPELQVKLLRVLEDGRIRPLGARQDRQVDVRILAATNANLQDLMSNGGFRRDLFYRLARYTVYVPPLRERKEDIPLLAEHFLRLFAAEMTRETPCLGRVALEALETYDFPGNIRELKNMMERAMLECEGKEIQVHHLHFLHPGPQPIVPDSATPSKEEIGWPDFERQEFARIQQAMTQTSGNITKAARLLGINRSRIYRMLRRHSLSQ